MPGPSKKRTSSRPRYQNRGEIDGFLPPREGEASEPRRGKTGRRWQLDGFLPPEEPEADEIFDEVEDDNRE